MFNFMKVEPEESRSLIISDNESENSESFSYTRSQHSRSTPHKDINAKVREYFTTIDINTFTCKMCERQLKGTVANMKAHLGSIHRAILDEINKTEVQQYSGMRLRRFEETNRDLNEDQASQEQPPKRIRIEQTHHGLIENQPSQERIRIEETHDGLIEFVINGGNLKNYFEISGKKLNRDELERIFQNTASKNRQRIKEELRGKLPYLTVIEANGLYCVVAHFIEMNNMKLKIRQLGCEKCEKVEKSEALKKILDIYEISKFSSAFQITNAVIEDKTLIRFKAQNYLNSMTRIFLDREPQMIDELLQVRHMQDKSRESFEQIKTGLNFCGSTLLREICKKVKKIRDLKVIFDKVKYVDENRWDSDLVIIESLKKNQQEFEKCSQDIQNFVLNYIEVFKLVQQTLKKIDDKKILFGDFFLAWTLLEIKLSLREDGVAKAFVDEMKSNENKMKVFEWKSGNFHANFFLDPRFKYSIDDEVFSLKAQHDLIEHCLSINETLNSGQTSNDEEEQNFSMSADDDLPIEYKLLLERTGGGNSQKTSNHKHSEGLRQKLKRFGLEPKKIVKPGENFDVLDFWNDLFDSNPDYQDLMPIASVILANPASRIELVNDFSALSLAFLNGNEEISLQNLNDFLLVSGNLDLQNFEI